MTTKSCTKDEDIKWHSETFGKAIGLKKIISTFKENPTVPKEVCQSYSTFTQNDKLIKYHYKVEEVLLEGQKQMVDFNKLGSLVQRYIETINLLLLKLHDATQVNHDASNKRALRAYSEKVHKDCPHKLLEVERRKLKDYRCLLQAETALLNKHYQKMDQAQYKMSEFLKSVRKSTKMLERRFSKFLSKYDYNLYCQNEWHKLKFGEKEMSAIVYNFCGRLCEMDKLAEEGRRLLECCKQRVEQLWNNKSALFEAIQTSIKDKLCQLKQLLTILTTSIRNNKMYRFHMTKNLEEMQGFLKSNPRCGHVLKYVEDTSASLDKLHSNDRRLKRDEACKSHLRAVDDGILHKRAAARRAISCYDWK